jgi:hypothetical protein
MGKNLLVLLVGCGVLISACLKPPSRFDETVSSIIAFGQTRPLPPFERLEIAITTSSPRESDRFYSLIELRKGRVASITDGGQIMKFIEAFRVPVSGKGVSLEKATGTTYHFIFFSTASSEPAYVLGRVVAADEGPTLIVRPLGTGGSIHYNREVLISLRHIGAF